VLNLCASNLTGPAFDQYSSETKMTSQAQLGPQLQPVLQAVACQSAITFKF